MDKTKSLWSDPTRTRHFLIPDSQELPPDDFILRTVTGCRQQVDPESLAPFQVRQKEAKNWPKDQFAQIIDKAKGALLNVLRQGQAQPVDLNVRPGGNPCKEKDRKTCHRDEHDFST